MAGPRGALVAVVLAAVLAGCNDDPEPNIPDPTTSAPTTAVTSSTSPTTTPTDALGPEETVRAWVAARNAALQDGNTDSVDALSAPNCRSCEELNKVIRQIYAAGGSFDTPGWTVNAAKEKAGSKPVQVDTAITFSAGHTTQSAGADPVSYDEEKRIVTFKLTRIDGTYMVQLVLFLS